MNKKTSVKTENIKEPYFTHRKKGIASLCCIAAVVLWLILWMIFPLEFYSLFFASLIGSNFLLLLLSVIITFPQNYICTKTAKADIPVAAHLIINAVGMVGCIYLYSIFRYDFKFYLIILGLIVHLGLSALLYIKSKQIIIPKIKTERKPAKLIITAVISTLLADFLYLMLFTALLETFRE